MSCILRICGKKTLNLDTVLDAMPIQPSSIYRIGELVRKVKIEEPQIIYTLSNADAHDLEKQIKDAIKFLKTNMQYLEKLALLKSIRTLAIDFSFNSRIDMKKVAIQYDYFPSELIKLAGSLNMSVWLTQWPVKNP